MSESPSTSVLEPVKEAPPAAAPTDAPDDGSAPKVEPWFDRIIRNTPWWALSVSLHALLLLVAIYVILEAATPPQEEEVMMIKLPRRPVEQEIEFPRDVFDNRKPIRAENAVEDPVFIRDAEESDHNETANEEEFQQAKGDSKDFLSDLPFKGTGVNDSIGVGGGAGGRYGGRLGGKRNLVTRGGGSIATEGAVLAGLRWLARHQAPGGHWDTDNFKAQCGKVRKGSCGGPGKPEFDSGNTGLAVLAFLGAGYTHHSRDTYDGICFGHVVKKGVQWLMANQDKDGCVGDRNGHYMYSHAIAALALSEAYGLTGSSLVKGPAQRSIDFLIAAQNPYAAWRYRHRSGDNDTSVTGWCVMALKSAEISGMQTSRAAYEGAKTWLNRVTDSDGRVGYMKKPSEEKRRADAMTAVGMMCRIFIDKNRGDLRLRRGAEFLVKDLPTWKKGKIDFYAWYYVSLALFQYDGPNGRYWQAWNERMKNALVNHQRTAKDGCLHGSWDTVARWTSHGGRVYATAINVLTLEVYYRYDNVFGVAERK